MRRKDVLFLCQFFYPEYNSSATLPWDTARFFAQQNLKVKALCGYPKEYCTQANLPLKEVVENVEIQRLKYWQLSRKSAVGRLLNFFSFTLAVLLHLPILREYRCIIVYSNPPVLPFVTILSKWLFGTKIIFVSYDVYPEIAYASNSLKPNGLLAKVMRLLNRCFFKTVDQVVALTEEMRQFLLAHRLSLKPKQVQVIPNWAHESLKLQDDSLIDHSLLKKLGWGKDAFVVSYFGNMGICQELSTLLSTIQRLQNHERICFLFVGHGNKKAWLKAQTADLKNVCVLDFLTGEDFEQALRLSACSVVSLEKGLRGLCAPSKYYSYLQAGLPVISITEKSSYLAKEIEKMAIGQAFTHGDSQNLADTLKRWSNSPEKMLQMRNAAKAYYQENYAKAIGLDQYYQMVRKVLESDEVTDNSDYLNEKRSSQYQALYRFFRWLS